MTRLWVALCAAASVALLVTFLAANFRGNENDAPSLLSIKLAHSDVAVRGSSYALPVEVLGTDSPDSELAEIQNIVASVTDTDVRTLSDEIFEKSKYSLLGSHNNGSSASFSTKKLRSGAGDKQFFVQFSIPTDIYTLAALSKFTGRPVISHVHDNLFLAIGGNSFPARALRFPGVVFVQERTGSDKMAGSLKLRLEELSRDSIVTRLRRHLIPSTRLSQHNPLVSLIVQCWFDACGTAAQRVQSICPDVYVHPGLVEVMCPADMLERAVSLLSDLVGVEHIDIKQRMEHKNFAGSAIVGSGPLATSISQSKVLTNIDVSGSVIGVADTGINMNNCYFYDSTKNAAPYANSRVVALYSFQPCSSCGRCCASYSPAGCTNAANNCGNELDQHGHGTHVAGTIAGNAGDTLPISLGNGISSGAKLFFQDIENQQPDDKCFYAGYCGGLYPSTQLSNLFQPAYDAGVRVHSNSWGCAGSSSYDPYACNTYSSYSQSIDSFAHTKQDFLILFAAGNNGNNAVTKTVGSPATCKNCLSIGATQLSDELYRGMKPLVDQGYHCRYTSSGCCADRSGRNCVQISETNSPCCAFTSVTKMSLPCCPTQYSLNVRVPYNVASFSGRGTTFDDGRIKPDMVVPGEDILSAFAPGVDGNGVMIPTSTPYCGVPSSTTTRTVQDQNNRATTMMSGTSMATPLAAGAVEKIRQYFKQGYYPSGNKGQGAQINPAESLLRAVILASAQPLIGGGVWNGLPYYSDFTRFSPIASSNFIPDVFGGFGMPILDNAVTMPSGTHKMFYISEQFSSSSGASAFNIACSESSIPVTLVLAWTDPPGFTSSKKQLVNDLDLIVLVPGGSPAHLFGNMRESADQSNNVERTICNCPVGSSITAIVVPGESLKTSSQTWYLVANGPVTQAITKLSSVPAYKTGRIVLPELTTTSCQNDPRFTLTLYFLPGKVWSGSAWEMSLKYQEFSAALSTLARVNFQAVGISLLSASAGTATLSLGCSIIPTTSAGSLKYITSSALFSTIRSSCGVANSICTTDPVLSVYNWTSFTSGSTPPPSPPAPPVADGCTVLTSCAACTAASTCGWCPLLGMCKTGTNVGSNDELCTTSNGWAWFPSDCAAFSPSPPTSSPPTSSPPTSSPPTSSPPTSAPPFSTQVGRVGAPACTGCPPGTYSATANASHYTTCIPCPLGTHSPNASALSVASCIRCPAGSYPVTPHAFTSSTGIQVGAYYEKNGTRALQSVVLDYGRCLRVGSSASALNVLQATFPYITANKCNGTHVDLLDCNDADCRICTLRSISLPVDDNYALNCTGLSPVIRGAFSCASCPSGSFSSFPNATALSSCLPCPLGTISSTGSSVCRPCPSGFFVVNATFCMRCPPGSVSTSTATVSPTSCTTCDAGSYTNANATVCVKCPAGSYSSQVGATSSSSCTPCPAGFFSSFAGAAVCFSCPNGAASSSIGRTSNCSSCPAGQYAANFASTACSLCPAGTFSSVLAASSPSVCTDCPVGTVSLEGSASCASSCPMGSYREARACFHCPSGTYSITFNASSPSACVPCRAGTYSLVPGANSTAACIPCLAGTYSPASSSPCQGCPASTFSVVRGANSSATCQQCPIGHSSPFSSSSSSACLACPIGSYLNSEYGLCMLCPSGTFAITTASLFCTPCPDGATAPIGSSSCTFVPRVSPLQSLDASAPIPLSEVVDAHIRNERPRNQLPRCPLGSFFIDNAPMPQCALCWVNHTSTADSLSCIPCPSGSASTLGAAECSALQSLVEVQPSPAPQAPTPQAPTPQAPAQPPTMQDASETFSSHTIIYTVAGAIVTLFAAVAAVIMIRRHRFLATSSVSETTGKSQAALNSDINEHVSPASLRDVSHAIPTSSALPDLLAPPLPDLLTLYAAPRHDPHHIPVTDLSKGDVIDVPGV